MGLRFRANLILTVLALTLISVISFSISTSETKFSKRSTPGSFSGFHKLEGNNSRQFGLTRRAKSDGYHEAVCAADALLADIRSPEDNWGTSLTFDDLKSQWEESDYNEYFSELDGSTETGETSATALKSLGLPGKVGENGLVAFIWSQDEKYNTIHGMQDVSLALHFFCIMSFTLKGY